MGKNDEIVYLIGSGIANTILSLHQSIGEKYSIRGNEKR